jgi:hypothetical protein
MAVKKRKCHKTARLEPTGRGLSQAAAELPANGGGFVERSSAHAPAAGWETRAPGCSVKPVARNRRVAPTLQRFVRTPSKGVDWSWPGRIMPAKSGWREGTRLLDFGFSRQKTSNDKVSLVKNTVGRPRRYENTNGSAGFNSFCAAHGHWPIYSGQRSR